MTVSIRNSANGEWKTNTFIKKKLQSMIMVTFTKLFVIKDDCAHQYHSDQKEIARKKLFRKPKQNRKQAGAHLPALWQ